MTPIINLDIHDGYFMGSNFLFCFLFDYLDKSFVFCNYPSQTHTSWMQLFSALELIDPLSARFFLGCSQVMGLVSTICSGLTLELPAYFFQDWIACFWLAYSYERNCLHDWSKPEALSPIHIEEWLWEGNILLCPWSLTIIKDNPLFPRLLLCRCGAIWVSNKSAQREGCLSVPSSLLCFWKSSKSCS